MKRRDFLRWVCLTPVLLAHARACPETKIESDFLCCLKIGKTEVGPFKVSAVDAKSLEQKIMDMDLRQISDLCLEYNQSKQTKSIS